MTIKQLKERVRQAEESLEQTVQVSVYHFSIDFRLIPLLAASAINDSKPVFGIYYVFQYLFQNDLAPRAFKTKDLRCCAIFKFFFLGRVQRHDGRRQHFNQHWERVCKIFPRFSTIARVICYN